MNNSLRIHWLQLFAKQSGNAHTMVVKGAAALLLLAGGMGGVVLPQSFSQAGATKQQDIPAQVRSINKAQQQHFAAKHTFAKSIAALKVGIKAQSAHYHYSTRATPQVAYSYGVSSRPSLRSYVGAAFVVFAAIAPKRQQEKITVAIVCKSATLGNNRPAEPILKNGVPTCAPGTVPSLQ